MRTDVRLLLKRLFEIVGRIEVIEGAHWSLSDYEGWMGANGNEMGRIGCGKGVEYGNNR